MGNASAEPATAIPASQKGKPIMSVETIDTLVVGAGQAGVAMSEHLTREGVPHIVLERGRVAERWRSERWDSLVANGPAWHDRFPGMAFADGDPDAVLGTVRRELQAIEPTMPLLNVNTYRTVVSTSLWAPRMGASLLAVFGGLALVLAAIGLYGVMSYMVARRRMEIGIRMALGAERGTVVRMVVGDAARLLAVGLVVGIGLSIWGARSARALLYGLEPWDPATLAMAVAALGAVALVASWLPADRASRAAPTAVLREE